MKFWWRYMLLEVRLSPVNKSNRLSWSAFQFLCCPETILRAEDVVTIVCHSDYAIREWESLPPEFAVGMSKFTMVGLCPNPKVFQKCKTDHVRALPTKGHEGCGKVVSVGATITKFKPGDMVAVVCLPGCADCEECSSGLPQLCFQGPRYGGGRDGFFAPYVTVVERAAIKIPAGVSAAAGAVATDACITAHHAVVGRAEVKASDTVLLNGLGGLGFNALQIILSIGARVFVLDKRQIVLDEAVKFGVPTDQVVPAETANVGEWLGRKGVKIDKVIDFVGMPETIRAGIESGKSSLNNSRTRDLDFMSSYIHNSVNSQFGLEALLFLSVCWVLKYHFVLHQWFGSS